jgi:hypothetical protein
MKWLTIRIFFLLALLLFPAVLSAQNLQIDRRAIEQVGKNAVAAVSAEKLVTNSMEKTHKAQEIINKYTTIVEANMSAIYKMQREIDAFRSTSSSMKEFVEVFNRTQKELRLLAQDISKYPLAALAHSKKIPALYKEMVAVGTTVITMITDGKESISGVPTSSVYENLLTPTKRLELLEKCTYEMAKILSRCRGIRVSMQYRNTLQHVAINLTPTAAISAEYLAQIRDNIIRLWRTRP